MWAPRHAPTIPEHSPMSNAPTMAASQWGVVAPAAIMMAASSSIVVWRATASPTCRRAGLLSCRCHRTRAPYRQASSPSSRLTQVRPSGMRPMCTPMMSTGTPCPLSHKLDAAARMLGNERPLLASHSGTIIPAKASHCTRIAAAAATTTTTGHGHGTRGSRDSSALEDSMTNLAEVDVEPDLTMRESCSVWGRKL